MEWTIGMEHWTGLLELDFFLKTLRVSPFTGLDYWTGIPDWTTGLEFLPFLDKFLYGYLRSLL